MQPPTASTVNVVFENWRGYQEKLRKCIAALKNKDLSLQPARGMWSLGQIVQHSISGRAGWFSGTLQDEDKTMYDYLE